MVVTFPVDGEGGLSFLELDWLRGAIAGEWGSKAVRGVQHPGVPRFAGEESQLPDGDKASVAFRGAALNVMHLASEIEFHRALSTPSGLDPFPAHVVLQIPWRSISLRSKSKSPQFWMLVLEYTLIGGDQDRAQFDGDGNEQSVCRISMKFARKQECFHGGNARKRHAFDTDRFNKTVEESSGIWLEDQATLRVQQRGFP